MVDFKLSYDDYFMNMAYLCSMKSKDQSTKIGAVVVGPDREIRSTGFNSFPRNINDDIQSRQERPEKYMFMAHAERNAIYNAARMGITLKDCTLYTPGYPCSGCAIACIQAGIKEVVLDLDWNDEIPEKWDKEHIISKQMFEENGINVRYWQGELLQIQSIRRNEKLK